MSTKLPTRACVHTNLYQQYSLAPNSFHWIVIPLQQSGADRWGFGPATIHVSTHKSPSWCQLFPTYANSGKHILKLVDKSNQAWIIDVDPDFVSMLSSPPTSILCMLTRLGWLAPWQAVGEGCLIGCDRDGRIGSNVRMRYG